MPAPKLLLLVTLLGAIALFYAMGGPQYISLDTLHAQQALWKDTIARHPLPSMVVFMLLYIVITALSLPIALVMTLLAGALFGLVAGTVIASFSSAIGATLAMLAARYVLRDNLQNRYGQHLQPINAGFQNEGAFYLFALRLVPVVPFFLVNILMGLLPIKPLTFAWVSQLGMLPTTVVYVYTGTTLANLASFNDILSPPLLAALAMLGVFPLVAKYAVANLRKTSNP